MKLGDSLKAGLLAGVLAGVILALFNLAFTSPLIDKAIQFEQAAPDAGPELFSRDTQKFGMVMGFLLLGLIAGLLFGVVYTLVKEKLPASGTRNKGLLLAFLAFWSVALMPFLKYPANPPGVGGEETIIFRQATYISYIAISLVLAIAGVAWFKFLAIAKNWRWPLTLLGYAVFGVLAYRLMPSHPFPPTTLPSELLWNFRAISLISLALFWVALGLNFVFLAKRLEINRVIEKLKI